MKISLYPPLSIHEIGQRPNQEDSIIQWNNRLFVLCDGMGGHEKGEVASQTVCQSLVTWFEEHITPDDLFTDDKLREALEYAYQQLDKYADGNPKQMGTTLTLLYIHKQGVTAAHIGDSRIYHIRPEVGVLYQSRDHSLVFDLFQAGEITYEEMANFPQKNMVTRAMTPGEDNRHRPDIIHITDIQPNDYLYICSDGMLEQMDNDQIVNLLSSRLTNEEKRNKLIELSKDNQDNHSAWIIQVKESIKEEGDERLVNEEPTARCNAINIIPADNGEADVQIINEDDVVVVLEPPTPKKKQIPFLIWIKWIIAAILCLIVLVAACFVLFGNDKKDDNEKDKIERMMRKTIKHSHDKLNKTATTLKDSNNVNRNDTARNQ
ncbi:PP2C family protein-serine/threonine phosphatase [Prevotella communis]|uniref:PP2C family protein-serine/threonine phosphatase n=1 Tax=Prevotella communis TaxID=2913614 RepID=UPI001EDC6A7D|nr:protein phosphatase 2C domain-containing protein [Prevotella communis]UKK55917.1 protein phosphatase 2C domain-containing protein [Prevotella communis]